MNERRNKKVCGVKSKYFKVEKELKYIKGIRYYEFKSIADLKDQVLSKLHDLYEESEEPIYEIH